MSEPADSLKTAAGPADEPDDGVPAPGEVLAGKFRVEQVLGGGGMGVVVAAMHLQLEERVAIKFLNPKMLSEENVARFAREARAAAKIKSPYVARVSDVGTLETGSPYMVMEYLEGRDLKDMIRDRGAFPVRDAVEYTLQAVEAVSEAHALGIIHRDIKPSNLFLANRAGGDPIVKVLDFGISKLTPRGSMPPDDGNMTRTSTWLGSPLYMSPEQLRSAKDVDIRADIWAFGVTLWELTTGSLPFNSDTFPELCAQILHEDPPSYPELCPDAPLGLARAIMRCLEKDREKRFANCAELATALVEFAPKRARSVAERAVSLTESAGLAKPSQRRPLDASLPDAIMSPLAGLPDDAFGDRRTPASVPPPPLRRASVPPRSRHTPVEAASGDEPRSESGRGSFPPESERSSSPPSDRPLSSRPPPQTSTTGGVSIAGKPPPMSSGPAPRRSSVRPSYIPPDFQPEPPMNPAKVVGIVAGVVTLIAVGLYVTGVFPPRERPSLSGSPAAAEVAPAEPAEPPPAAPEPSSAADPTADEGAGGAAEPPADAEDTDAPEAEGAGDGETSADGTGANGTGAAAKVDPAPAGKSAKRPANDDTPSGPPEGIPVDAPAGPPEGKPVAEPEPPPPAAEPAPPPVEPVAPTTKTTKCYQDAPDGTKVEVPCPW